MSSFFRSLRSRRLSRRSGRAPGLPPDRAPGLTTLQHPDRAPGVPILQASAARPS